MCRSSPRCSRSTPKSIPISPHCSAPPRRSRFPACRSWARSAPRASATRTASIFSIPPRRSWPNRSSTWWWRAPPKACSWSSPRRRGSMRKPCSAPWCSGTSRCRPRSRRSTSSSAEAGKPKWTWIAPEAITALKSAVSGLAEKELTAAYAITEKQQRYAKIGEIKSGVLAALTQGESIKFTADQVGSEFFNLEYRLVRERILEGHPRIDGRDTEDRAPDQHSHRRARANSRLGACSPAARPRRWWSPPWAPVAMRRSSTG